MFSIIAITTTIGYVSYSMHLLDNYSQTFLTKNQERMDNQKEQFKVTQVSLAQNKFNITVQNTGEIPININRLYVQNTTTTDWFAKYSINTAVSPAQTVTNLGMSIPLSAVSTKSYDMKLITERGNSQEFLVSSSSSAPVFLQLFVLPVSVPNGFTTSILLAVTNNMSNNVILTNITPNLSVVSNGATAALQSSPQPITYGSLSNGNTVYFQWTYSITGATGSSVMFNATLQNPYPGNFVTSTVTVQPVQFAGQSGTSITSHGLSALATSDTRLIFHKETTDALNGYQMYSVAPDATGQIIQLDTTTPIFYTNNDTVSFDIPAGKWNATLRYLSSPIPSTIPTQPDLIYHFEDGSNPSQIKDSSVHTDNLSVSSSKPTWGSSFGPNATGSYSFSGSQYFYHAVDSNSNFVNQYATTAGWFKTNGLVSGKQDIFRVGDTLSKPFYEVAVDVDHKLLFQFSGTTTGSNPISCKSSTTVDNSQWHHFVAVRGSPTTGAGTCTLYLDGLQVALNNPGCSSCTGNSAVGNFVIGAEKASSPSNTFNGMIDDVMYWNNYAVTNSPVQQVTDLLKTSYGSSAHKLTFTADIVDQNGNFIEHVNTTSISNYPFSFYDSFGSYPTVTASSPTWGLQNFTFNAPEINLTPNQRLQLQINFVSPNYGKLPMKFDIDNSAINGITSGLQIPPPSSPLPGYYICNSCTISDGTVNVYNLGPYIAWLTQNSRVTFETYDGTSVYASWVTSFAGFSHGISSDSLPILVGTTAQISFSVPHTGPGIDPSGNSGAYGTVIPAGHYRMYIYLNGYDQKGNVLLGTQYVGPVKVT